ncbi:AMP-binding protein [Streptomyces turgidiscabies]|uniref:AMP-binding protein n=1 Tax=Streptomyces turgidiscabies TaxID=85558 RepID=UPI0038F5F9A8
MPRSLLHQFLSQPPRRTAVIGTDGDAWTFDRLLAAACRTADLLRPLGCAGRTVLIHTRGAGGPWFAVADLAVLLAHGVSAVIPEHLTETHSAAVLHALQPAAVVDTAPGVDDAFIGQARHQQLAVISPATSAHQVFSPSGSHRAAAAHWAAERPVPAAAVVFTSGTTGPPRGVVLRDRDLVDGITAWTAHWPTAAARPTRTVAHLPVAHIAQRIMGHYLMCLFGTTVCTSTPERLSTDISLYRPDILLGVPHTWSTLDTAADQDHRLAAALGAIGLAVNGGAALDTQLAERLARRGLRVAGAYGATETTVPAFHQPDLRQPTLGTSVGIEHRLAADGELLLRSPHQAAGYVATWPHLHPATDEGGWLHTGDRARERGDGQLVLAGRAAAAFKTGKGRLVHPEPAESLLVGHPLVDGACLVGDGLPATIALVSAPSTSSWPADETRALEDDLAKTLDQAQRDGLVPWTDLGRVHIVTDSWPAAALVTVTGKPRRDAITTRYADLLTGAPPASPRQEQHA